MQVFEMAPASGRGALWIVISVVVLLGIVLAVLLAAMRPAKFEVSREGLRIRGSMYGRMVPAAKLNASAARVVDLKQSPELRPKYRTNGIGLPGRISGWVRLANGEKSLCFVTRDRAVYIPTSDGYTLLLTPDDPDRMLSAVQAMAP